MLCSWRHGDNRALRFVRFWPSTLHITCDAAVVFMLHGGWGWGGIMTLMLHVGWGWGGIMTLMLNEGYGDVEVT